jgi:hypothetical protein
LLPRPDCIKGRGNFRGTNGRAATWPRSTSMPRAPNRGRQFPRSLRRGRCRISDLRVWPLAAPIFEVPNIVLLRFTMASCEGENGFVRGRKWFRPPHWNVVRGELIQVRLGARRASSSPGHARRAGGRRLAGGLAMGAGSRPASSVISAVVSQPSLWSARFGRAGGHADLIQ